MDREHLIKAIQAHSSKTGLAPATITGRAANNSRLYYRLVNGGDCTMKIAQKVLAYMAENPPAQAPEEATR